MDDHEKKSFIYKEEGLPSQFFASPPDHANTLSSTNIEREDIQRAVGVQDPAADSRSVFGGSQSASASMSANMHRIVEDVERLVESDTYENPPGASEQPAFLSSSKLPTPSGNLFEPDNRSPASFRDRNTPMAPPGLGPLMTNPSATLSHTPSPQPYTTPLLSIPGFQSIWNTGLSSSGSLGGGGAPRPPPGLDQQPSPIYQSNLGSPTTTLQQSQESSSVARDLLRQQQQQQLLSHQQQQNQYPNLNTPPIPPSSSPWTSPLHRTTSGPGLGFTSTPPSSPGLGPGMGIGSASHQPMSSNLPFASWANDAFIANHSNLHSSSAMTGYQYQNSPPPGLVGSRRAGSGAFTASGMASGPGTQLGAIGETPPCGQGG